MEEVLIQGVMDELVAGNLSEDHESVPKTESPGSPVTSDEGMSRDEIDESDDALGSPLLCGADDDDVLAGLGLVDDVMGSVVDESLFGELGQLDGLQGMGSSNGDGAAREAAVTTLLDDGDWMGWRHE